MAWRCHQASYMVAYPFTNTLVFVMPDSMKAVNPFIKRIPNELQQQYVTDYITEMLKLIMGEAYNINDSGIPFKYGNIVAFARKI
jgi:hypothetical protein